MLSRGLTISSKVDERPSLRSSSTVAFAHSSTVAMATSDQCALEEDNLGLDEVFELTKLFSSHLVIHSSDCSPWKTCRIFAMLDFSCRRAETGKLLAVTSE